MLGAFVGVLRASVPEAEIAGIYFKGSAQKEWTTPVDYVPELSDVDIHVLFSSAGAVAEYLGSLAQAIEVQAAVEAAFLSAVPAPLHTPRLQLLVLNSVLNDEDFIQTPLKGITILYGRECPEGEPLAAEKVRALDAKRLRGEEAFLARFPLQIIDKSARYNLAAMRTLAWRVSPTAPRVLSVLGRPFNEVWTANRTRLLTLLEERGEAELARQYGWFYLSGWDYFLSGYTDHAAARRSIAAGAEVLRRGVELAKQKASK